MPCVSGGWRIFVDRGDVVEAKLGLKILVVDDQKPITNLLREVLESQGYDVVTASSGGEALEQYRDHRPAFTLTDISMPGMSGLSLLRQIKDINPAAVVMLMTGAGSESFAVEALRGGAVNYFHKPIDLHELSTTLRRYTPMAQGYDYEQFADEFAITESLELALPNDLNLVNHGVQLIVNHCRTVFPLSEIFTLRFGLYEMIVNAIEHGNLNITYEEKSKAIEEERLTELIRERASDPHRLNQRVQIKCQIARSGLRCTILDQGNGFDHSTYSAAPDPSVLFEDLGFSLHGRGIILTRLQFDELQYNEKGNEVKLFKRAAESREKENNPQ